MALSNLILLSVPLSHNELSSRTVPLGVTWADCSASCLWSSAHPMPAGPSSFTVCENDFHNCVPHKSVKTHWLQMPRWAQSSHLSVGRVCYGTGHRGLGSTGEKQHTVVTGPSAWGWGRKMKRIRNTFFPKSDWDESQRKQRNSRQGWLKGMPEREVPGCVCGGCGYLWSPHDIAWIKRTYFTTSLLPILGENTSGNLRL